jgi:hypothetical protein
MRLALCLILTLELIVCAHAQNSRQDDSLIYLTIMKSQIPFSAKSVFIVNQTAEYDHQIDTSAIIDSNATDPDEISMRKNEWEHATKSAFDSIAYRPMVRYYLSDHHPLKIDYDFSLPFKVVYLPASEYETGKENNQFWEDLRHNNPKSAGVVEFSEVFYSVDRSRAVVYYAIHAPNARGSVFILQGLNGKWKLKAETKIWYSELSNKDTKKQ